MNVNTVELNESYLIPKYCPIAFKATDEKYPFELVKVLPLDDRNWIDFSIYEPYLL